MYKKFTTPSISPAVDDGGVLLAPAFELEKVTEIVQINNTRNRHLYFTKACFKGRRRSAEECGIHIYAFAAPLSFTLAFDYLRTW